ncbi:L-isoaspartyl protein carboxyl methyltransferase [Globomyces pollinis-pini]|nr:L-isoaspartyl protein carboxyl methyltransferase [Globomyces pollinis-pini]
MQGWFLTHEFHADYPESFPFEMAWRSSGNSNLQLVKNLKANRLIEHDPVFHAMKVVDRANFTNISPYEDSPQPIGYNATISAPHMHAYALETLYPYLKDGAKVLDVGSGSGYLCACLAQLVGKTGKVVGIDHIPELVEQSIKNIQNEDPDLLESGVVQLEVADGREGYPPLAPYDAIHVGAYTKELPGPLVDQLKPGGAIFVPMGYPQQIFVVKKDMFGNLTPLPKIGVSYVPLTSKSYQLGEY